MKILITGGTGYIGGNLLTALVKGNHTVAALIRESSDTSRIQLLSDKQIFRTDGTLSAVIKAHCEFKPELVIHLAALVTPEQGGSRIEELIKSNIIFGAQVLEGMHACGCKSLINTGSAWQNFDSERYQPVNLYGATKQAFEDISLYYADALQFKIIHLFLFDTYGENDPRRKLLSLLKTAATTGEPLRMTPGEQLIYPVHIEDVCCAYQQAIQLIEGPEPGEVRRYGVRACDGITVKEVTEKFISSIPQIPLRVEFGGIPYRNREVMNPWIGMPILEGWRAKRKIEDAIRLIAEQLLKNKST